jgi:Transcription factor Pcc1
VAVIVTRGGAVTATEAQIAHRVLLVDDDLVRRSFSVPEPVIEVTYACDP